MDNNQYASRLASEMKSAGHNFTRPKAEIFIDALSEAMAKGLSRDRKLTLSNFGTFIISRFGAKIIKSPRGDNKQFFMPPTDVIKWRPSMKVRDRAATSKVSDEDYQKLISGEIVEELPVDTIIAQPKEKKLGRYEVRVNVHGNPKLSHMTNEGSPVSKLVRSLIRDFIRSGSKKLEIRPEGQNTLLVYCSVKNSAEKVKSLPIASHQIIIEKLKLMTNNSVQAGDGEIIKVAGDRQIKLSTKLTSHGQTAILELI